MTDSRDTRRLFSGDRLTPSVALVFGDADAFRVGMGVELHEHSPPFAASVAAHDAVMPRPLADLLWYPGASAPSADDVQHAAAVLTVGAGAAAVFHSEYDLDVARYAGRGLGHVTAAIAAGILSLTEALQWIAVDGVSLGEVRRRVEELRGESSILTSYGRPEELIETLSDVDALVDVGPGDAQARSLRGVAGVVVPVGSWDSAIDRLRIRDQIRRHTFYNPRYVVERTLGQLASTRMLPHATGDHSRVIELARSLRTMLRRTDLPTSVVGIEPERVSAIVGHAVSTWIESGRVKGYPQARILASIAALEDETLFPLRRAFGLDAEHVHHAERNATRHAS